MPAIDDPTSVAQSLPGQIAALKSAVQETAVASKGKLKAVPLFQTVNSFAISNTVPFQIDATITVPPFATSAIIIATLTGVAVNSNASAVSTVVSFIAPNIQTHFSQNDIPGSGVGTLITVMAGSVPSVVAGSTLTVSGTIKSSSSLSIAASPANTLSITGVVLFQY